MQNKHYSIICKKKIPNLTKNDASFPSSASTGTIPKVMEKNTIYIS